MMLTADMLAENDACSDQVDKFRARFPEGTEITEASCMAAAECGLKFNFLAAVLFDDATRRKYVRGIAPDCNRIKRQGGLSAEELDIAQNRVKARVFWSIFKSLDHEPVEKLAAEDG